MTRMNPQTRIIVATAFALAVVDIAVRFFAPSRTVYVNNGGNVVTAQQFRLVDNRGNERALLKLDENGEPGLLLFDKDGALRLQLDTFQNTPSLILNDRGEMRRVYFGMDNSSGAGLYQNHDDNGAAEIPLPATVQTFTNVETIEPAEMQDVAPAEDCSCEGEEGTAVAPAQTITIR